MMYVFLSISPSLPLSLSPSLPLFLSPPLPLSPLYLCMYVCMRVHTLTCVYSPRCPEPNHHPSVQGRIRFDNMRLKPDIVDQFGLPIVIKHGYVGHLEVLINWKALFPTPKQPVRVEVDEIFLVVSTKDFTKEDLEKIEQRKKELKKEALKQLNEETGWHLRCAGRKKDAQKNNKDKSDDSFTSKLVTSIVNNIQVGLKIKGGKEERRRRRRRGGGGGGERINRLQMCAHLRRESDLRISAPGGICGSNDKFFLEMEVAGVKCVSLLHHLLI